MQSNHQYTAGMSIIDSNQNRSNVIRLVHTDCHGLDRRQTSAHPHHSELRLPWHVLIQVEDSCGIARGPGRGAEPLNLLWPPICRALRHPACLVRREAKHLCDRPPAQATRFERFARSGESAWQAEHTHRQIHKYMHTNTNAHIHIHIHIHPQTRRRNKSHTGSPSSGGLKRVRGKSR